MTDCNQKVANQWPIIANKWPTVTDKPCQQSGPVSQTWMCFECLGTSAHFASLGHPLWTKKPCHFRRRTKMSRFFFRKRLQNWKLISPRSFDEMVRHQCFHPALSQNRHMKWFQLGWNWMQTISLMKGVSVRSFHTTSVPNQCRHNEAVHAPRLLSGIPKPNGQEAFWMALMALCLSMAAANPCTCLETFQLLFLGSINQVSGFAAHNDKQRMLIKMRQINALMQHDFHCDFQKNSTMVPGEAIVNLHEHLGMTQLRNDLSSGWWGDAKTNLTQWFSTRCNKDMSIQLSAWTEPRIPFSCDATGFGNLTQELGHQSQAHRALHKWTCTRNCCEGFTEGNQCKNKGGAQVFHCWMWKSLKMMMLSFGLGSSLHCVTTVWAECLCCPQLCHQVLLKVFSPVIWWPGCNSFGWPCQVPTVQICAESKCDSPNCAWMVGTSRNQNQNTKHFPWRVSNLKFSVTLFFDLLCTFCKLLFASGWTVLVHSG